VKSFDALKEILAKHEPGDKVSLSWLDSSGKKTTKNITLGESSVN
jgi:S1-C subfamily serine protease